MKNHSGYFAIFILINLISSSVFSQIYESKGARISATIVEPGTMAKTINTDFGNVAIIPVSFLATGFEYKEGARFSNGFKNANYWDAHLAYFANKNLTLVAAYVNAGDYQSKTTTGLGDGVVLSAQYAF